MADIGQVDMGEMTRRYGEEEVVRIMKEIMKNNEMMLKLQKQIGELQMAEEEKRRQVEYRRREREQEETDRWIEKCRKRNEKEREEKEEQKRIDEEWRRIEGMKRREEKRAEKEWRYQDMRERRREENRQTVMKERKCFGCREFGHMASHCRNEGKGEPILVSPNRFEVLKVRVMQKGEGSGKEVVKDRKKILREERAKRGVEVRQTKVERKEKKEKLLREVMVKVGLKQEEEEEGVVTEALLDSGVTGLVMSEEFSKKHRFRRTKLERPVYVRNVNGCCGNHLSQ